jgi:hypothetical protein
MSTIWEDIWADIWDPKVWGSQGVIVYYDWLAAHIITEYTNNYFLRDTSSEVVVQSIQARK